MTDNQLNNALHFAECLYAVCRIFFIVKLSVVMLNVIMLSVVAQCNCMARPLLELKTWSRFCPVSLSLSMQLSVNFFVINETLNE